MANLRENYLLARTENAMALLTELHKNPSRRYTDSDLSDTTDIHGGSYATAKADIRIMGLINNDRKGVQITEKGQRFLTDENFRKEVYFQIPYYAEMYNRNVKDYDVVFHFLKDKLHDYYDKHIIDNMVGMATARYLELIWGVKPLLGQARRKYRRNKTIAVAHGAYSSAQYFSNNVHVLSKDRHVALANKLKELRKEYSHDEIETVLEMLK